MFRRANWTGSDQSRPSPLILPTAAGLILLWIVACSVLPWLPIVDDRPAAFRLGKVQFTIRYNELSSFGPAMIGMAAGLPTFFFTLLAGSLVGQHSQHLAWLSMLLRGAELGLGLWLIRLGPRRTIAYLLLVLLVSTCGSFVLKALVRM